MSLLVWSWLLWWLWFWLWLSPRDLWTEVLCAEELVRPHPAWVFGVGPRFFLRPRLAGLLVSGCSCLAPYGWRDTVDLSRPVLSEQTCLQRTLLMLSMVTIAEKSQ